MKTIFRFLMLGVFATAFSAAAATASFAQDECANVEANQALYKKYTDNYAGKIDQIKIAIDAAKQYIEKYGACVDKDGKPLYADQVNYLKGALKERTDFVNNADKKAADTALLNRFDAAAKSKNVPDMYSSGKEILARESDFPKIALDVTIALASAGFEQSLATPPVDTYNADTISYAKSAMQQIEAGKTSESYGVWSYNIKGKAKDNKGYALGALDYIVANVTSYRMGKTDASKKKDALPYFYKSLQYDSFSKTDPTVYQAFGAWYSDEVLRIDGERTAKVKAAGNKDTDETIAMLADQKGYADRAIDAYARAYKLAKDDKNQKAEYTNGLYDRLKVLYAFRYDNKTDGIDTFISTVMSKPLPDPATPITPVKEEVPAPATTTGTTATPTPATTPGTTPATKPATTPSTTKPTTPTKPASSTTAPKTDSTDASTTEATTTTDKTKAKKPAPKKKGTR